MENASYNILINADSGKAAALGEQAIKAALANSKIKAGRFDFVAAGQFTRKLKEVMDEDLPILIGGGDGTITQAAKILLGSGKKFGILPFGTMNLLAHDLSIPEDINDVLDAYSQAEPEPVDVATLNDQPYLCAASLGVMPEASRFREKNRENYDILNNLKLGAFIFKEMDTSKRHKMKICIDGETKHFKASAIIISNNQYTRGDKKDHRNFTRASLQEGKLGIYIAAPHTLWDRIRLLLHLQTDSWRDDASLWEFLARTVTIETGRDKELISLDGEPMEMSMPLEFAIKPAALEILRPVKQS